MGRILIVAEKSSVGHEIAKLTDCTKKNGGYIVGNKYVVTWARGHLVGLCDPKEYKKDWKKWSYENLPIIPEEIQIKPIEIDHFNLLKNLMNDPGIDSLICGTDSGREGEFIFRLIYTMAGCKKPFKRLWISSLTDESILNGLNNLKDSSLYDNLYQSALSRAFADWLVGINSTRAFSLKYRGVKLPIGRVQTPTLALIVKKQKEIDSFISKDYWEVKAYYDEFNGQWVNAENESRIFDEQTAKSIADKVKGKVGKVDDIKTENIKEQPPLLYDLASLQKDASKKFGLTAQETLDIVQSLYERKHVTYPRTDCSYLSEDMVHTIPERLRQISMNMDYSQLAKQILELPELPLSKRIVDNTKITDHHAIIPDLVVPRSLNDDELNVYDLIVRRFIAVFFPDYEYTIKTIKVKVENEIFSSKGKTVNKLGWTECYKKDNLANDTADLPENINIGDDISVLSSKVTKHSTKPPSHYTDGTLISAMENAARQVDDKKVKEALNKCGLGTSATRAAIIEKLIENNYVQRWKGFLKPTQKGMDLIEIVPEELRSAEMTGKWEQALSSIEVGKMDPNVFISCITDFVKDIVNKAYSSEIREDLSISQMEQDYYRKGGSPYANKNKRYSS